MDTARPSTEGTTIENARRGTRAPAMKCPKCTTHLELPAPRADGLAGVLYRECLSCGHVEPVRTRTPKEKV